MSSIKRSNTCAYVLRWAIATALLQVHTVAASSQPKPGYGVTAAGVEFKCPKGTYNTGENGSVRCSSCGGGYTTLVEAATSAAACLVQKGWAVDPKTGEPRPCNKGSWSNGGTPKNPDGKCVACPAGFTTQEAESTEPADCEVCLPGYGGEKCTLCAANTFSSGGGKRAPCRSCPAGQTSAPGSTNSAGCYKSLLLPDQDYFYLSDDAQWTDVGGATTSEQCSAMCDSNNGGSSTATACIMHRWGYDTKQCQHLLEVKVGSLLGFRIEQGADYVIYEVKDGLEVGDRVGVLYDKTLEQCLQACGRLNTCEGFRFPGWKGVGTCVMFASVLDAEYQTVAHVSGRHLFSGRGRT